MFLMHLVLLKQLENDISNGFSDVLGQETHKP